MEIFAIKYKKTLPQPKPLRFIGSWHESPIIFDMCTTQYIFSCDLNDINHTKYIHKPTFVKLYVFAFQSIYINPEYTA